MLLFARLLVAVLLIAWLCRQVRKPSGWLGRRVVGTMNFSHSAMTDWALEQVSVPNHAAILDIGCGGTYRAETSGVGAPGQGNWTGLLPDQRGGFARHECPGDRDRKSRDSAGLRGGSAVRGREFRHGERSRDALLLADLPANVREVLRVLKPGGRFVLIAEAYRGGPFRLIYGVVMPLLRAAYLSDEEHRDLLTNAGFTEVATQHKPGKNWILATGCRPL